MIKIFPKRMFKKRNVLRQVLENRLLHIYIFLLPTLGLIAVFNYYPFVSAFYHALTRWNIGGQSTFIGFDNFKEVLGDEIFWISLWNIAKLVVFFLFANITLPLLTAASIFVLRNKQSQFVYRVLFTLPMVIPEIVLILIWRFIYDPNVGILNNLLDVINLHSWNRSWLGDESWALYALMGFKFPWIAGMYFLLFWAGLELIPNTVREAAALDGCTGFTRFFYIDLPLLKGQIRVVTILTIIGVVQKFWIQQILTDGGPGWATMVPGLWMFKMAFDYSRTGYACAIGVILFGLLFVITFLYTKQMKSALEYEAT